MNDDSPESESDAYTEIDDEEAPPPTQREGKSAIIATLDHAKDYAKLEDEEALPPTQREWKSATVAKLDHTKDCAKQVKEALRVLEQQEADRLAAKREERKRQRALAEAAEKKRKEAIEVEKEKHFKRLQADELTRQQNAVRHRKQTESAALRAATANFKKMTQAEKDAKEKERVKENLKSASTKLLENTLECTHLRSKLWGALKLCERRRELRKTRPPAEMFMDYVDQALDNEFQMLTFSRNGLKVLAMKGNDVRGQMQAVYTQLNFKQSREKSASRMMRPSSAPLLLPVLEQVPPQNDVLQEAITFTVEGTELARQSALARSQINTQCDRAAANVNANLDRRKAELGELIAKLQDQKTNSEKTIADAERRIIKLKERMWRSSPDGDSATDEQVNSAESLLVDLGSLKNALAADLSNKYHALKIDESCRLFTKTTAGGHVSRKGQQSLGKSATYTLSVCDEGTGSSIAPAG